MSRQAGRRARDIAMSVLSIGIVGFAAVFGGAQTAAREYIQRLGIVSASLAVPDAGIPALREYMQTIVSDAERGETEPDLPVLVEPDNTQQEDAQAGEAEPEETAPVYDQNDLAAAEALIPEERRAPLEQIQFASTGTGGNYFYYGAGTLNNATEYATSEMQSVVDSDMALDIEMNATEPQVLIVHTHSTESFDRFDVGFYDTEYPTRTTDSENNIVAVGQVLCDELNALGINTVHATEYHDYPSYNNSYSRSRVTVQDYLTRYPSIKIVLDIHRDGMQREDGTRVKPVVEIGGEKIAQIMIVSGAGDDQPVPEFRENLKFAARLQDSAESLFPGFTRPVYFAYRYYNHDLTPGSLVIEVGSEGNTLQEAKNAAKCIALSLANLFRD